MHSRLLLASFIRHWQRGGRSITETVTSYAGTSLVQIGKTITTTSADRRTITSSSYIDSNTSPASVSGTSVVEVCRPVCM